MIRFLFVLGNFLEDPSANHFCHVDIIIKDYIRYLMTIFATQFQSSLMAIFRVIIPGLDMISTNPVPIENGATSRQLILVQKSGTD